MRRRYALLGATSTLVVALAIPALGGPSNPIAESALSLKKTNKAAKKALKRARAARDAADAALSAADAAQSAAGGAQSAAGAAQATGNSALGVANGKQDGIRWALVSSTGQITAQSGGISMTSSGLGVNYLNFGSSQTRKAIIATLNWPGGGGEGQISTAVCGGVTSPGGRDCAAVANTTSHVYVETENSTGTEVGRAFYVAVIG